MSQDHPRSAGENRPTCKSGFFSFASRPVEKLLHGGEGGRADVVFDTFGVRAGAVGWNAERFEKSDDSLVAEFGFGRKGASAGCEKNGAVGAGGDEAFALQALDSADHGDVGDTELAGDVGGAGFAVFSDQVGDSFDVILGAFLGMGAAGLALVGGAFAGLGAGGHSGNDAD